MMIHPHKLYWIGSSCGKVEVQVPGLLITDLNSAPGRIDETTDSWAEWVDWSGVDEEALIADLQEYGCDWEYSDEHLNHMRFLWTASAQVYEAEDPSRHEAEGEWSPGEVML